VKVLFLVEYDRIRGELASITAYEESARAEAENARLTLELRLNRERVEREVVLLEAASEDALRLTHRRYFEDVKHLIPAVPE